MLHKKRIFLAILLFLILLMISPSCGSKESTDTPEPSTTSPPAETVVEPAPTAPQGRCGDGVYLHHRTAGRRWVGAGLFQGPGSGLPRALAEQQGPGTRSPTDGRDPGPDYHRCAGGTRRLWARGLPVAGLCCRRSGAPVPGRSSLSREGRVMPQAIAESVRTLRWQVRVGRQPDQRPGIAGVRYDRGNATN